ncbi:MAG: efflux transporter outer membrane subunit [Sphingomonas sp.]
MHRVSLLALSLVLAGCTMGPNYAGPPAVGSAGKLPATFARAGAATPADAPRLGQWWTALGDATLDTLEQRALAGNPDVAIAEARLRQARASLHLERANQLPSGSANASYLHAQLPGVGLGSLTGGNGDGNSNGGQGSGGGDSGSALDFYNVGFDASWEVDLFGAGRRRVEAARAQAAAAEADVADAQVSLTAEMAQSYVDYRDRQRQLELARQSAAMQQQMLDLAQQRYAQGVVSQLDVERLRDQVENSNAQLVPIQAQLDAYRDALAVLTGVEPGAVDDLLAGTAPVPLPPASVPIGDPAALLSRRPDIRAAERQIAQRTAQIGAAEAARLPSLKLLGLIGLGGTSPGDVFDLGNLTALASPMLQWNVLDFGRGAARVEQARGQRDEAAAQYRKTVLGALRDAEDALSRFGSQRRVVGGYARAKASADRAAALMQQRYHAGAANLTDLLDVERQRVAAEQSLATATAQLTGDYVSLQKALGLGWQAPAAD